MCRHVYLYECFMYVHMCTHCILYVLYDYVQRCEGTVSVELHYIN